jgi:hypothetical protein
LARWEGLGQQYAALSRAEHQPYGMADAIRWEARGAFYKNMAESQLARGQAAGNQPSTDVVRLVALGESYEQMAQAREEVLAGVARWIGLGERYK